MNLKRVDVSDHLEAVWESLIKQEKEAILGRARRLSNDKTLISRHFMWVNQEKVHIFREAFQDGRQLSAYALPQTISRKRSWCWKFDKDEMSCKRFQKRG